MSHHYAIPALVDAGFAAFGQNSRYVNNDTHCLHEALLLDVAAGRPAEESLSEEVIEADENPMESKILQDTLAFIKSIAKERGRNVEWALQSVVKSASITSEEAIEKGVIEILASSDEDLLKQLDELVGQLETDQ